jgi:hypothetical protein
LTPVWRAKKRVARCNGNDRLQENQPALDGAG